LKYFTSVEFVASENVARFTTFGRGVWDFQIALQPLPLPVELTYFKGKVEKNQSVSLSWTTQSEKNVSHFDIERSTDGQNFEVLKTIPSKSKGGNSTVRLDYTTNDMFPPKGTVYYRLKTQDFDRKISYSKVIALQISGNSEGKRWAITPSIVAKNTPLSIFAPEADGGLNLSIFDVSGRLIRQMQVVHGQQIDLKDIGQTGVFVYRLNNKTHAETGKILLF
jgi:hypothetical protein